MDKLEIYNMALDFCGQEPLAKLNGESSAKTPTERTLDNFYGTALRKASREHAWPFLEVSLELASDLGPGHGYAHSYELPYGSLVLTWAEGDRYERIGGNLYTDGKPEAYGIIEDSMPDNGVPEDFYDLVAIALAYYASIRLSPDTTTRNAIWYAYQDKKEQMVNSVAMVERRVRNAF